MTHTSSDEPQHEPVTDAARDVGVRLMLAYQAGNESAFDQIVERYSGQVFALISRFRGSRAGREDLVQEVFLRVIRARVNYQPRARFSTWLYRIVYNICVNETQRAAPPALRLAGLEGDGDDAGSRAVPEPEDERALDPSAALETDDVVQAVRRAIEELPKKQRLALLLAKYHEMPYAEIAGVLETTEQAIKSLVHRARESLRESLAAFIEGELA